MKKVLFLLMFPIIGFSQYTSIPDKVFEETLIDLEYDTVFDGKVLTANIIRVKSLEFNGLQTWPPVSDFTGIKDFEALEQLSVRNINLKNIDFLSNNKALTYLNCEGNQLTSLDLSNNKALTYLNCESNQLTNLIISSSSALTYLNCKSNQLTSLDVRNGNNQNFINFNVTSNPNLTCINVDNVTYSTTNWTNIDAQHYFSTNCSAPNSVQEIPSSISIYPNPTSENITISIENFNGNIQTEVYDLIGNRLQTTNETTISLQDYARGIYLLKVAYGNKLQEVKVIKQ